ncbi:hypothetical protein JX580_07395 [Thiomicrospira microaerophila]|uniref:hypothetical protein n=1 Tax=Thiomicrospira microaerophila TaxID=406020 RepID=UPI00200DEF6C|nr:hypothetical protein [Thiomicrospira microaerophila]UQB41509.1 hypothetical protein JX580_07395 [Thiomicrospira microaerophila]
MLNGLLRVIWVGVICLVLIMSRGVYATEPLTDYPSNCFLKTNPNAVYAHAYEQDEFVIFYNSEGDSRLVDLEDANNNKIPDVLENIMIQLITMRDTLDFLGFRHPFDGKRYRKANAEKIYIRMANIRGNGLAFDEAHQDLKTGKCVLLITLSNSLSAKNLTPAHELFHLYQYGYTMFKQAWFLEGTARWSEDLLRSSEHYPQVELPQTPAELEAFFRTSYGALNVWNWLLMSVDNKGFMDLPSELLARQYLDGEEVIGDQKAYGVDFMIAVLGLLDRLDSEISREQDLSPIFWPEAFQRDPQHNDLIWKSLLNLYRDYKTLN